MKSFSVFSIGSSVLDLVEWDFRTVRP